MGKWEEMIYGYYFYTCGHMRPNSLICKVGLPWFYLAPWECWRCDMDRLVEQIKCSPAP